MRFEVIIESKNLRLVIKKDNTDLIVLRVVFIVKVIKAKMYLVQIFSEKPMQTVYGERKDPFRISEKLIKRYATENTAKLFLLQTELY